jgi:protein-S-isoprenylcysteine O-methyltransferase
MPMSMPLRSLALLVFFAWLLVDGVVVFRRRSSAAENRDRRSLRVLMLANAVGWWIAIALAYGRAGAMHAPALQWAGIAVMVVGIAIRSTAIAQLGRFHTPNVAVLADHRLMQDGLYRWVRHPSYLGALVAFVGLGLALGNWLSLAVIVLVMPAAYLFRIREEDAALAAGLGEPYRDYCRRTKRLIPGVY